MDKIITYGKMCDCPEIQKQWKFKIGDWILELGTLFWVFDKTPKDFVSDNLEGYTEEEYINDLRKSCIWLPRQDQVQEMLIESINDNQSARLAEIHYRYYNWIQKNCCIPEIFGCAFTIYSSFNQLWLAYYMYEKYNKIWDGEKWILKENL